MSVAYAAKVAFNGTQYGAVVSYYWDPHQRTQKEGKGVGGLVELADKRGGAQ